MQVNLSFISGVMAGFEFVEDEDAGVTYLVIDLFIVRILLDWSEDDSI